MSVKINPQDSHDLFESYDGSGGLSSIGILDSEFPRTDNRSTLSNLVVPTMENYRSMDLATYFTHACVVERLYESNNKPLLDHSLRASLLNKVQEMVNDYDIKAVFWDADGTLFHTEFAQFKLFQLALEKEGSFFTIEDNQRRLVSNDWKKDFIPDLTRKLSEAGSTLEIAELMDSVFSPISTMFEHHRESMLRPEVFETLIWLQNCNIPCGIATLSKREELNERLIKTGIFRFFQTTLTIDDLSYRKPHPESLIKLAEASGIPESHYNQCLVIGDTQNDFEPAKELHMRWICYDDTAWVEEALRKRHHVHDPLQRYDRDMDNFSGLILPRRPME